MGPQQEKSSAVQDPLRSSKVQFCQGSKTRPFPKALLHHAAWCAWGVLTLPLRMGL